MEMSWIGEVKSCCKGKWYISAIRSFIFIKSIPTFSARFLLPCDLSTYSKTVQSRPFPELHTTNLTVCRAGQVFHLGSKLPSSWLKVYDTFQHCCLFVPVCWQSCCQQARQPRRWWASISATQHRRQTSSCGELFYPSSKICALCVSIS